VLPYIPKGIKNIIIVPDSNLANLPFDILRENATSPDFGETYSLSLSPSISVSALARQVQPSQDMAILAFGNAVYNKNQTDSDNSSRGFSLDEKGHITWNNLPGTGAEVQGIEKIAEANGDAFAPYLGEDVREDTVKELSREGELRRYPIIHFACHGYFDDKNAGNSGIVFSEVSGKDTADDPDDKDDGYLTIPEIAVMDFDAKMVVLSACETGLGQMENSKSMVGLTRAFLVAGTQNVGVSLWEVNDESTSKFMDAVYTKVLAKGESFRQAYYEVKNDFRHGKYGKDMEAPMFWAAFVLYE
jgi:CHAT domain-containing protein